MEGGTQCPHAKIRNAQHYSRALESLADRGTQVRGNFIGRILDSLIDSPRSNKALRPVSLFKIA